MVECCGLRQLRTAEYKIGIYTMVGNTPSKDGLIPHDPKAMPCELSTRPTLSDFQQTTANKTLEVVSCKLLVTKASLWEKRLTARR